MTLLNVILLLRNYSWKYQTFFLSTRQDSIIGRNDNVIAFDDIEIANVRKI